MLNLCLNLTFIFTETQHIYLHLQICMYNWVMYIRTQLIYRIYIQVIFSALYKTLGTFIMLNFE